MNCEIDGIRCKHKLDVAPFCELDKEFDIIKAEGRSEVSNYSKTDNGVCGNYEGL